MALIRLTLPTEIDLDNSPDVRRQILEGARADAAELHLMCSGVDYIDSTGMAMLIDLGEHLSAQGVHLVLDRPSRAMQIWMNVSGLADHFCVA